jgi:hypothetical protein
MSSLGLSSARRTFSPSISTCRKKTDAGPSGLVSANETSTPILRIGIGLNRSESGQIRAGDQSQDRESAAPRRTALAARPRRRGDRIGTGLLPQLAKADVTDAHSRGAYPARLYGLTPRTAHGGHPRSRGGPALQECAASLSTEFGVSQPRGLSRYLHRRSGPWSKGGMPNHSKRDGLAHCYKAPLCS